MSTSLSLSQVSEFLGDSADCLREAIETLVVLDKHLPAGYNLRIKRLIVEVDAAKKAMEGIKGEIHRDAYEQQPDIFSLRISVKQAEISRLVHPLLFSAFP